MVRIISAMFEAGTTQLEKIKSTLSSILIATIVGVGAVLFLRPSVPNAFVVMAIPYIYTICRLLSTERLFFVHAVGESLEFVGALGGKKEGAAETGIFENPATTKYIAMVKGVFLAQSMLFLMTPLYVNYTSGNIPTALMIGVLTLIVAVGSSVFFVGMFTLASRATIFLYVIVIIVGLFPQSTYYFNQLTENRFSLPSREVYKLANEIKANCDQQLEERKIAQLRNALNYQKANPGRELPREYQQKVEEVGRLVSSEKAESPQPRQQQVAALSPSTSSLDGMSDARRSRLEKMAKMISGK